MPTNDPVLPDLDDPEGIFALMPGHPTYVGEDVALRYFGIAQRERLLRAYRENAQASVGADPLDN